MFKSLKATAIHRCINPEEAPNRLSRALSARRPQKTLLSGGSASGRGGRRLLRLEHTSFRFRKLSCSSSGRLGSLFDDDIAAAAAMGGKNKQRTKGNVRVRRAGGLAGWGFSPSPGWRASFRCQAFGQGRGSIWPGWAETVAVQSAKRRRRQQTCEARWCPLSYLLLTRLSIHSHNSPLKTV